VMDAEDLQCSALKAIGNYDRCVRHDQLARTRDAAGAARPKAPCRRCRADSCPSRTAFLWLRTVS